MLIGFYTTALSAPTKRAEAVNKLDIASRLQKQFSAPLNKSENSENAKKHLKNAVLNNLGPKNGGSKYTLDLFEVVATQYNEDMKLKVEGHPQSHKQEKHHNRNRHQHIGKSKMMEDPYFETVVQRVVDDIVIEGGNKKPSFDDILIIKLLKFPLTLFKSEDAKQTTAAGGDGGAVDMSYYKGKDKDRG